jgi:hypothetical protein
MRSSHRILGSLLLLCLLAMCGKTSQPTKPDVGVPDTSGTKADAPVGGTPDTGSGQPDVGPGASDVDVASALPDASGADAAEPRSDAGKPKLDAITDRGEVDAGVVKPDGAVDSPASLDGSRPDGLADGRGRDIAGSGLDGGAADDEIVRLCALAASCGYYASVTSPSQCVQEFAKTASRGNDLVLDHLRGCASARGCSEFSACWGGDLFSLGPIVWDGGCEGNRIRLPTFGSSVYFDCGKMGASCDQPATTGISAVCNVRPCYGAGSEPPSCAGTVLTTCGDWAEFVTIDCSRIGLSCNRDDRQGECVGSGAACKPSSDKVTCSGSVATYCAGGAQATIDCANNPFATRCASGAPSTEPCAAAGTECEPSSYVGGCDDVGMKMCVNGYVVSVDCHALGLVSCTVPATGGYACCKPGT